MKLVLDHLRAGRLVAALERMQTLWPRHRNAAFAEAFDLLGEHLDRSVPALPTHPLHPAWMERCAARKPADMAALTKRLFEGTSKRVRARVDALKELPPDPRTTPAIAAYVPNASPLGASSKILTGVFRLHLHVGDPRLTQVLQERRNQLSGAEWFEEACKRFDRAIDRAPEPGPPPKGLDEVLDVLRALLDGPAPGREVAYAETPDVAESIREKIFEDPDDDGPIAVWADALTAAGDDLGALVSLQLHRHGQALTKKEQALQKRLVKAHRNRLLGPLRPVVDLKTATFERGLLATARVSFKSKKYRDKLREHPWWGSVHSIHTTLPHLRSGVLPRVRRFGVRYIPSHDDLPGEPLGHRWRAIDPPPWSALVSLAKSRTALPIESVCALLPEPPDPAGLDALVTRPGLPDLAELHLVFFPSGYLPRDLFSPRDPMSVVVDHPALANTDRLVLDGFLMHDRSDTLPDLWSRIRTRGQSLVLLSDGPAQYTVWEDDAGLHVDASTKERTQAPVDRIARALGDGAKYASITVRGPTWAERLRERFAKRFDATPEVVIPKKTRGS